MTCNFALMVRLAAGLVKDDKPACWFPGRDDVRSKRTTSGEVARSVCVSLGLDIIHV